MSIVVVVIPTYNEAETISNVIRDVLESMRRAGVDCHVLVIDDNSPDVLRMLWLDWLK